MFRKFTAAALGGLIASFALAPSAQATGDVWVEGSYEYLALPNVQFINQFTAPVAGGTNLVVQEFVNDDGDFDGFRIDGGIADIPIMGGAYVMGVKGFFAWHDDRSDLQCSNTPAAGGTRCLAVPIIDDDPLRQNRVDGLFGITQQFTTERDINHWGVALEVAQGPMGLKAGPAFRRIDQNLTITGRGINAGAFGSGTAQLTYSEDLETNYWGGFIGGDGSIDLGGGWSLQADAEAGLYWANTDYSGSYVVTNGFVAFPTNENANQQLSLESDELAFIGVLKAALEKDFGLFKLAGFGRVEYISSAPDVAYNDRDSSVRTSEAQGPDDETRLGERFAYTASAGARITVPMGSGQ